MPPEDMDGRCARVQEASANFPSLEACGVAQQLSGQILGHRSYELRLRGTLEESTEYSLAVRWPVRAASTNTTEVFWHLSIHREADVGKRRRVSSGGRSGGRPGAARDRERESSEVLLCSVRPWLGIGLILPLLALYWRCIGTALGLYHVSIALVLYWRCASAVLVPGQYQCSTSIAPVQDHSSTSGSTSAALVQY